MAEGQFALRLVDQFRRLDYPDDCVYLNQDSTIETLWKRGVVSTKPGPSVLEEKLRREGSRMPERKKPDILVLDTSRRVLMVVEAKDASQLSQADINQGIIYGQKLHARVVLVISETETTWFNPGQGVEGTPITLDGVALRRKPTRHEEFLAIAEQITENNSALTSSIAQEKSVERLARTVWQQIFASARVAKEQDVLLTFSELILWKILCERDELQPGFRMDAVLGMPNGTRVSYYKNTVRSEIRKLYPKSLNGFFLNASKTHEDVFEQVLGQFLAFGMISKLDVDLKSHMYEIFLESSPRIRTLGQFFTPRVVCRVLVEMAQVSLGHRVHDPACGTGGFLIETAKQLMRHAQFSSMKISGEEVDETVHLLATSNFFISGLENDFNLISTRIVRSKDSGVGSLGSVERDAYDRIFANPPYVRTGIQSLKKNMSPGLTIRAGQLQGFFMEKMVRELAPRGRAFVIMPFGILLNTWDQVIRDWLLLECHLDGIVSLPPKLFRNSERKTYVLCLTRKQPGEGAQSYPVFGYIVKDVGFSLDARRERIPDNDLIDDLVPQWLAWDKKRLTPTSDKAHLVPLADILEDQGRCMIIENYFPSDKLRAVGAYPLTEDYDEAELRREVTENLARLGELLGDYEQLVQGATPFERLACSSG